MTPAPSVLTPRRALRSDIWNNPRQPSQQGLIPTGIIAVRRVKECNANREYDTGTVERKRAMVVTWLTIGKGFVPVNGR